MKSISLNALHKQIIQNQEQYKDVICEFKKELNEEALVERARTRNADEKKILDSFTRK